jgi:hypothetical protein
MTCKTKSMKERPILMSTPMVQAILQGRKTMTRRIIAFPEDFNCEDVYDNSPYGLKYTSDFGGGTVQRLPCKYGTVGDRFWVRETFTKLVPEHFIDKHFVYKADMCYSSERIRQNYIQLGYPYQWKPSIFMPRSASRITLEITNIRVERLQSISEEDAIREGVGAGFQMNAGWPDYTHIENGVCMVTQDSARMSFWTLWESINGLGHTESWEGNPWVWVIEFKVL